MDDRYLTLVANRQRKIHQADGWKLHVVVCDELAFYLNTTNRNANKEAGNLMRDLVSRGRATGVIFLAATQKPERPTPSRPTCATCSPSAGRSAPPPADEPTPSSGPLVDRLATRPTSTPLTGASATAARGRQPVRMRTFYLTDDDLTQLARQARRCRPRTQSRPRSA